MKSYISKIEIKILEIILQSPGIDILLLRRRSQLDLQTFVISTNKLQSFELVTIVNSKIYPNKETIKFHLSNNNKSNLETGSSKSGSQYINQVSQPQFPPSDLFIPDQNTPLS